MSMRQLEVRHCGEKRALLGWIQVPDNLMVLGKRIDITRPRGVDMSRERGLPVAPGAATTTISMQVASLPAAFGGAYLCLKADGFTVDQCEQLLSGFNFVRAPR
jgi:hypothetical protein